MLRITMLSGEEVASMPLPDLSDVRALKEQLHRLHGLPTRFRQRLFHCGNPVDDATPLDAAMELSLVLLSYIACSERQKSWRLPPQTAPSPRFGFDQRPSNTEILTFPRQTPPRPLRQIARLDTPTLRPITLQKLWFCRVLNRV